MYPVQYYFSNQSLEIRETYCMDEDDSHHMIHVMRMKVDDEFYITDRALKRFVCRITAVSKKTVNYEPIQFVSVHFATGHHIKLIYSLVKQDKFEFVLQKSCELGVDEIVPYLADYSIIKIDPTKESKKYERWNKILKEASEQSQRYTIPVLSPIATMQDVFTKHMSQTNIVCATEDVNTKRLSQLCDSHDISIVIGPEGGFSPRELAQFTANDFRFARLTKNILRTETAAIYAITVIDQWLSEANNE